MKKRKSLARRSFAILALLVLQGCQKQVFQFQEQEETLVVNNPPPPSEPATGSRSTESALRVQDRKLLDSTLNGIFGPQASAVTALLVMKNPDFFARPCDTSEPSQSGDPACQTSIGAAEARTHIPRYVNTPSTLPASITSEILRIRTCEEITAKDPAVVYAARLAESLGESQSPSAELPLPDATLIAGAFELFHPGKTAPDDIVKALLLVAESAAAKSPSASALEGWRIILLTLCLDPSWQIL